MKENIQQPTLIRTRLLGDKFKKQSIINQQQIDTPQVDYETLLQDIQLNIDHIEEKIEQQFQEYQSQTNVVKTFQNNIAKLFRNWSSLDANLKKKIQLEQIIGKVFLLSQRTQQVALIQTGLNICAFGFSIVNFQQVLFSSQTKSRPPLKRPQSSISVQSFKMEIATIQSIFERILEASRSQGFNDCLGFPISQIYINLIKNISSGVDDQILKSETYLKFLNMLLLILRTISNDKKETKYIIQIQSIGLFINILHSIQMDNQNKKQVEQLTNSITVILRNLIQEKESLFLFMNAQVIEKLVKNLELFPQQNDIVLNTLRILSQLSQKQKCCQIIKENQLALSNIANFFRFYASNIYIIIRVSNLLADLTTYYQEIREMIYFQFQVFDHIYGSFQQTVQNYLKPEKKNLIDQFGITSSGWDFNVIKQETHEDALVRLVRLIANLITVDSIGQDLISKQQSIFIQIVSHLKNVMKHLLTNNQITNVNELAICLLNCLTNVFYYEKQTVINDFTHKNSKIEILQMIGHFVIQNENEEVCCDGLRLVSNLSRQKDLPKHILNNKLTDGMVILLDSSSQDIVYYCLGGFLNLLQDSQFRIEKGSQLIEPVLRIMDESTVDQKDIVFLCLKCLNLLFDQNFSSQIYDQIEKSITKYGQQCDEVLSKQQPQEVLDIRQLINDLINKLPETTFTCQISSNILFQLIHDKIVEENFKLKMNQSYIKKGDIKFE